MPATKPWLAEFPRQLATEKDPIPEAIWPDLRGVLKAPVREWPNTLESWERFWRDATHSELVSVDTETSGLRPFHGDRLCGVSAAFYDGKTIQAGYWNFRHRGHGPHPWCRDHEPEERAKRLKTCERCRRDVVEGPCPGLVEPAAVVPVVALACLAPVFRTVKVGGQNFKFDCKMFHVDGLELPRKVLDTKLIAHLWDENGRGYNLDKLAREIGEKKLGDSVKEYMEEHGLKVEDAGHAEVAYDVERPYAIADAVVVLKRLQWERQRWAELADPRLMDVFQIENACTPVVAHMEIAGLKLDGEYVQYGVERLEKEITEILKRAWKLAKREFDLDSPKQVWEILEGRGLKPVGVTAGGQPGTGATELEAYVAQGDEMAQVILDYRSRAKTLGTYLKPFRDTHVDPDGFIHSDFFIDGTTGGRMSSRDPNLQNATRPEAFTATKTIKGNTARMIQQGGVQKFEDHAQQAVQVRRCFVAPEGFVRVFFDYDQMELRDFADYSEEEYILAGIRAGGKLDIHELVAREIFPNFPEKDKNPTLYKFFRQLTKQINFGIIYGMGKAKLALQLNVPLDETVRALRLVQRARELELAVGNSACVMTDEEIEVALEDHRVMASTRNWAGLRSLGKDVSQRVDVPTLEEALFTDDNAELGLRYSAESFLNKYHARFPKIKAIMRGIDKVIRERGWIFNRFGRRYHLTPDKSYVGLNRLVQGTTADMVKLAMHRVYLLLTQRKAKSRMVNQVHDELQMDIHLSELDLITEIKEAMELFPSIGVPFVVSVEYSVTNWAEKRPWSTREELLTALQEQRAAQKTVVRRPGAKAKGRVAKGQPVVQQPPRRAAKVSR